MVSIKQFYIPEDKPASYADRDLFEYCVKKVREKDLFAKAYTHNQWANLIFKCEKETEVRIELMSKVKREYTIYFTHDLKYSFDKNKIRRDFRDLWGNQKEEDDGEYTCEDLVNDTIKAVKREIIEQRDPHNIESFKGSDLVMVRQQGQSYIYQTKLTITDGQEPNLHEGIPFMLHVYSKEVNCETVDFDFMTGTLFFTANRFINPAPFCRVLLDSSFILNELEARLEHLRDGGVDESLPFSKFLFDETRELKKVKHATVPPEYYERLDPYQKKAFHAALDNDITFIWGPPGTGKSFTLASILYALYQLGEDRSVVCCLSNVAVDQLLCKVIDIVEKRHEKIEPGNIYRAGRSMDGRVLDTAYLYPRDQLTQDLRDKIKKNNDRILSLKERKREKSEETILLKAANKELREKLREHTEFLVDSSRLVFSTISNFILNETLYQSKFDNLIVDEASMMAMPSLLALGHKIAKRLILVGDFQQLSPIALVKDDFLTDSVFEMSGIDIRHTNHPALHQLLSQRRSNEKIVDLINKTFYKGKLVPKAEVNETIVNSEPFGGKVVALKNVKNGAVRFTKGGTRQNEAFAKSVIELLDDFSVDDNLDFSIGIITPYRGQVSLLRALKAERHYSDTFEKRVKIGTVHTFQGSECDVIIFDMVDCADLVNSKNEKIDRKLQIGRLYWGNNGERLVNVAISRARHKLIVVCSQSYIEKVPGRKISPDLQRLFHKLCQYTT